jgi:beta-arabinofuranosyltransferase
MLLPQHHHHREPPRRGGRRPLRGGVAGLASSLAGCLLLGLVATAAMLCLSSPPSRARQHGGSRGIVPAGGSGATPRVTIFSAPRPPPEGSPARQELAVRSWLALPGNVSVVLLGAGGPETVALAARLGHRVTADAAIDFAYAFTRTFYLLIVFYVRKMISSPLYPVC